MRYWHKFSRLKKINLEASVIGVDVKKRICFYVTAVCA